MNSNSLKYRYTLETYDPDIKKHVCPACGKRSLVRYIDVETGEYVSTEVGRCDREQKCGYHKRPRDFFDEHGGGPRKEYFFPKIPMRKRSDDTFSVVARQLANDTMTAYEKNNLMLFIKARWGKDALQHVISTYRIGTCRFWPGSTIFWQQDCEGRFRTGKIMLYNRENGHRVKDPVSKIMWVHKLPMFSDFHLRQCLFGEHLIKCSDKPVAIVESEKTAIIASLFFPDAIWVATGGLNNLQGEKLQSLKGREIILFPDLGAETKWIMQADAIPCLKNAKASTWLMKHSTQAQKDDGLDIGDWLTGLPSVKSFRVQDFL